MGNMNAEPERKLEKRLTVNTVLERMLEKGVEVGSGKDAVVFKVNLSTLPPAERHILAQGGIIAPKEEADAIALKILKIYDPELGDHEFQMQKNARAILLYEPNTAKIPDTTIARHQKVGSAIKSKMNARGGHVEKEVGMVVMDYIDGQDLGNIMYDFVLKQLDYEDSYIADLTFSQKEQLVGQELSFELPDLGAAKTQAEEESLQAVSYDRNEEKLLKYLQKKGFTLPPIFEKLDNAVRSLNKNGIHHNDLHRQNIMLGKKGEVYIIDFGRAGGEKRVDGIADTMFSRRWRVLNQTETEIEKNKRLLEKVEIEKLKKRIAEHPIMKNRLNSFLGDILNRGTRAFEREFTRSRGDDVRFEQFLVMLLLARESNEVDSAVMNEFISTLENKNLRPFEHNTFLRYKNYLKNI